MRLLEGEVMVRNVSGRRVSLSAGKVWFHEDDLFFNEEGE